MALESISTPETEALNPSTNDDEDNDLEDGEIPSDEDDDPFPEPVKAVPEPPVVVIAPPPKDSPKDKTIEDSKSKNNKKSNRDDRSAKQKSSDDWAGDVEKAIKAVLEEDKIKDKSKSIKNNKNRARKRSRDEKSDDRPKDTKKKKNNEDENCNEDDDEMLFIRGASPTRKDHPHHEPSPLRRGGDRDNYSSGSEFDDRSNNRHRDNDKRDTRLGRRATKNDRANKNKSRAQMRNDRGGRRNQNDIQDADSICVYFMQGKCHRGDLCPYSHDALPPRKMELCKFYLMDCCAKRDKCLYMHHDFPCKFYHTGLKCTAGENCKFSHEPMTEQVKNILLKHLETAPKEILGNFPRLSREGAIIMINNTEKNMSQGQDSPTASKIPSLFEVKIPAPGGSHQDKNEDGKDRKSSKKTRWGSDDDRVPIDMVLKSANQYGINANNGKNSQDSKPLVMNFYSENSNKSNKESDSRKDKDYVKPIKDNLKNIPKDVDLRQLITALTPQVVSVAEEAATLKQEEESDHDEESSLIIEMPAEEEEPNKNNETNKQEETKEIKKEIEDIEMKTADTSQELPTTLPKKTQELYMRIQQQQKEAEESFKNLDNLKDEGLPAMEDWYSDDNDDDDDDEMGNLTIVGVEDEENVEIKKEEPLQPAAIPEPSAIVDKLGDISKIDISMEVSKLLSTIKAQSSANSNKSQAESNSVPKVEHLTLTPETCKSSTEVLSKTVNLEPETHTMEATPISRDPRMSRDPRQRREETTITPAVKVEVNRDPRAPRLETSIYSSGIISATESTDDFRSKDQDHRRKDMDFRQCFSSSNFGDTDLRLMPGQYTDAAVKSDVDLRPMLNLPFKPVPSHVPCTEIEAGISSHAPIPYKVEPVEIPRADFTGLKLTRNDPQVKYDPRLRKIFRLSRDELADSPMSPPPVAQKPDTPKSPPLIRTDPRRKALEATNQSPKIIPTTIPQQIQDHQNISTNHTYGQAQGMPSHPMPGGQNRGLLDLPQGPLMNNSKMTGMRENVGPMNGALLNSNGSGNIPPGGMNGPNMHNMSQNQMNYDHRYNPPQRNSGVGLLGAAPPGMGYGQDSRAPYDMYNDRYNDPGYAPNNYSQPDHRSYQSKGDYLDCPPYVNTDWNNQPRINRKDRRRCPGRGKFSNMRKKDMS